MEYYDRKIERRKTKQIKVGNIGVGSDFPITVQSMTNTLTSDTDDTVKQITELENAGADLVRVSCPDNASTKSLKKIINKVRVPIIADIHFHFQRAIEAAEAGAACLRINPGNIGNEEKVRNVINTWEKLRSTLRSH